MKTRTQTLTTDTENGGESVNMVNVHQENGDENGGVSTDNNSQMCSAIERIVSAKLEAALAPLLEKFLTANPDPPPSEKQCARDKVREKMPTFTIPQISEQDKLSGTKNYQPWLNRLELGLRTVKLEKYIQEEHGGDYSEDLSEETRLMHDAQALQYLRATINAEIGNSIIRKKTAYSAFKAIEIMFSGKKLQELVLLEENYNSLHFRAHYNPIKFVNDFENRVEQYRELGTVFDEELLIARFLAKIDDRYNTGHPYSIFYNMMRTLPEDLRTFDYVKRQFLDVDNSRFRRNESSGNFQFRRSEPNTAQRRDRGSSFNQSHHDQKNFKRKMDDSKDQHESSHKKPAISNTSRTGTIFQVLKGRVKLSDLYPRDQIEKIKTMSMDEKKKMQCKKCRVYFHDERFCPYPSELCYNCFHFGHSKSSCKNEKN